jgi:hypothetical protein
VATSIKSHICSRKIYGRIVVLGQIYGRIVVLGKVSFKHVGFPRQFSYHLMFPNLSSEDGKRDIDDPYTKGISRT